VVSTELTINRPQLASTPRAHPRTAIMSTTGGTDKPVDEVTVSTENTAAKVGITLKRGVAAPRN